MNGTSSASLVHGTANNLADVLERVLDKGIIILGDVRVRVLDIELLTLQIRLVISSLDKAREMGLDWWNQSPMLADTTKHQLSEAASGQIEEQTQSEATGQIEAKTQSEATGQIEKKTRSKTIPVKRKGSTKSRKKRSTVVKE
jgi:Gas vesicle protein